MVASIRVTLGEMPIRFSRSDDVVRGEFIGPADDAELSHAMDEQRRLLEDAAARGERVILIIAPSATGSFSANQRTFVAAWNEEHRRLLVATCRGCGVIVRSPLHRAIHQIILWLSPYPVPIGAFESEAEAITWIRSRLRDSNESMRP